MIYKTTASMVILGAALSITGCTTAQTARDAQPAPSSQSTNIPSNKASHKEQHSRIDQATQNKMNKTADHHQHQKTFTLTELDNSFYFLQGNGGNMLISKGEDGLLLIDSNYEKNMPALQSVISHWPEKIVYLVNTHWHSDHTGGNPIIGQEATIIAHENTRNMLRKARKIDFFKSKDAPMQSSGLPELTFNKSLNLYFNDQKFVMTHLDRGHTLTDIIIKSPEHNIVHVGDLFFNGIFPFVDVEHGGRVSGMIKNITKILNDIDDETVVVPGHGTIGDKDALMAFHKMLAGTHKEVQNMMNSGMSLAAIQSKGLNPQWQSWGQGMINEKAWIGLLHASITSELADIEEKQEEEER